MDDLNSPLGETFKENFANSPLYKMKQSVVKASPFGEKSELHENRCGEFDTEPRQVYTQFHKLVETLSKGINDSNFLFDSESYIGKVNVTKARNDVEEYGKTIGEHPAFEYETVDGAKAIGTVFSVKLNSRKCYLEPNIGYRIKVDPSSNRLMFVVLVYYADTKKYRREALDTIDEKDFRLESKYVAVQIETQDARLFEDIIIRFSGKKSIKSAIKDKFDTVFHSISTASDYNWFYSVAPEYVIDDIGKHLLWDHLVIILDHDAEGWFSWFKDSSNAMLNIVKAFCKTEQGIYHLYDKFSSNVENPHVCYKIYEHMSGTSNFKGQQVPNKTIFTGLMISLSELNLNRTLQLTSKGSISFHERNKSHLVFKMLGLKTGSNTASSYTVDSNIASDDSKYGYFDLTQKEFELTSTYNPFTSGISTEYGKTESLHPLDLVLVDEYNEFGARVLKAYPAIYVKDTAFHEEWGNVMQAVRIAADILLVIVPFGIYFKVIKSISKILAAVAVFDGVVAGIDLVFIGVRPILEQSKAGRNFMKHWDTFYSFAGITTGLLTAPAAIAALGKLSVSGGKLLWKIANTVKYSDEIQDVVIKALFYSIRRSPNFPPSLFGQIKFITGTTIYALFGRASINILKLQEHGVIVVGFRRVIDGKPIDLYYLIYRDVIIVETKTSAEIERAIAPFFDHNGQILLEILEGVADTNQKIKVRVKNIEDLGKTAPNGIPMKLILIDNLGNKIGHVIRSLTKGKIEYKLFYMRKKIDLYSEVYLLDFKQGLKFEVPVKKGENILYADFAIPVNITEKLSGLGKIMLDDAKAFFTINPKFGDIDGVFGLWLKSNRLYSKYGGQSVNLTQFWNAVDKGMTYEQAAFQTFTGGWAKDNEFTKLVFNPDKDITKESVLFKFLK